jgi:hypothetical protein
MVSIFPQRGRVSVKEHVSTGSHKATFDSASVELNHNEDFDDEQSEEGPWVDILPGPEERPAKRSRKADKATPVSPHLEQSHLNPHDHSKA